MTIKAIETVYKGYRFRSRLEARWAVFFDALNIRYEYETQGFVIEGMPIGNDAGGNTQFQTWTYLPDFFLPDLGAWVEVKGSLDSCTEDYFDMIAWCVDWSGSLPGMRNSRGTTRGLIWLGAIPDPHFGAPVIPILQHEKGGRLNLGTFGWSKFFVVEEDGFYFDATSGEGWLLREHIENLVYGQPKHWEPSEDWGSWRKEFWDMDTEQVSLALSLARSARFEHGEKPRTR